MNTTIELSKKMTPEEKDFFNKIQNTKFLRLEPVGTNRKFRSILVIGTKAYPVDRIEATGTMNPSVDAENIVEFSGNTCFILSRGRRIQVPKGEPHVEFRRSGRMVFFYGSQAESKVITANRIAVLY